MKKRYYFVLLLALVSCSRSFAQWTMLSSGSTTNRFESAYFFDANNGIMSGTGGMIKTTNAGTSWTSVVVGGVRDIDFTTTTTGYAAGIVSSSLKKTTDGGTSWTPLTPINSSSLWGVSVVDANTVYVSGVSGIVWKTINGGANWSAVNLGVSDVVVDLQFFNATTGCALGQTNKVYRTTNGGISWTVTYTTTGVQFTSIYFVTSATGFAVGSNGRIIKSTDGGITWTALTSGSTAYLQYVHFYDVNNGIVAGFGGVVLRTTNGGTSWFPETTGTTRNLYSCILLSPTVAIIGGDSGTVMKNINLTTGIEQVVLSDVNISAYPNPFSDNFTCIVSGNVPDKDLTFELYDIEGKRVLRTELNKNGNNIKTNGLGSGTYMYAVKQKEVLIKQGKIIKTN